MRNVRPFSLPFAAPLTRRAHTPQLQAAVLAVHLPQVQHHILYLNMLPIRGTYSPLHLPRNLAMLTHLVPPRPIPLRPQSHSQCSEPFYRAELETDIRAEPSKSAEERARMMELLRRFEADALDDPFADEPDEPDDPAEAAAGDDLERRLAGMDLGASPALRSRNPSPSRRSRA